MPNPPPAALTDSSLPLTVAAWLAAYRGGARAGELLPACLERARAQAPAAAWIVLASDAQLAEQIARLEAIAAAEPEPARRLERYPLFGVPYAAKDNIDIAGVPTTAACPAFTYTPTGDANVIRRLREAGAVWIGKTNLDQFATGLVGTRSPYGQPSSVFSAGHVSGGSSSGSAVVVAAGLVPFSLGTDTAGSGRVPAGFNNVVGLKPTPGRVGASGVVPACRTLDCVSVFALGVADAAHVLSVIEGEDPDDSYSRHSPGIDAWPTAALRIGVPAAPVVEAGTGYAAAFADAVEHARSLGHEVIPIDFSVLHETAALLYSGPWVAERQAAVGALLESNPQAFDPVVREVIGAAARYAAADAFRGQYALKALQKKAAALWQGVDLLMVPTAPTHPTKAAVAAEPISANNRLGTYTNFVNLLGWCALAVPAAFTPAGLPFGVTFIAPADHDVALAGLGAAWQDSLDLPCGQTGIRLAETQSGAGLLHRPAVADRIPLAVVGAHMSGMPLNHQLLERGARLASRTATAAAYRLFALPGPAPQRPGLLRSTAGGTAIALEVWDFPSATLGSFIKLIPSPLGLGSVELADGQRVVGFLCEAWATEGAIDVSAFGGWRNYLNSQHPPANPPERTP